MSTTPDPRPLARTEWLLPRLWAGFLLALLAATYRLWLPAGSFPPVPLIDVPAVAAGAISAIALAAMCLALLAGLFRSTAIGWSTVAICLATLFVLDQHRLQPWAYQSMIYALLFAALPAASAQRWMMVLTISIYLYSGLGKLDYQFAHSVGTTMLETAAAPLGGIPQQVSPSMRARAALMLPAVECLLGIGLIFAVSRRVAAIGVIAMHLGLIALLGPWGLDHSLGVLIWNGLLIVQAWWLFLRRPRAARGEQTADGMTSKLGRASEPDQSDPAGSFEERRPGAAILPASRPGAAIPRGRLGSLVARGLVVAAVLLPLGERRGYWDHWLSWALYSPHSSRVEIELHRSILDSLGPDMRAFLEPDQDRDGWRRLDLSRWSLQRLGAPIYPQARYQLGLARAIARDSRLEQGIRVIVRGPADRWSGERERQFAIGPAELDRIAEQFWLGF